MVNCRCRYCGQMSDRPMIFTYSRQRVFNFIWDNPGCTFEDMAMKLCGSIKALNSVEAHVYHIRRDLRGTKYEIINSAGRNRRIPARYTIREIPPSSKPETANADVQSPNSLP